MTSAPTARAVDPDAYREDHPMTQSLPGPFGTSWWAQTLQWIVFAGLGIATVALPQYRIVLIPLAVALSLFIAFTVVRATRKNRRSGPRSID